MNITISFIFSTIFLIFSVKGMAQQDLDSVRNMFHNINGKKDILKVIDYKIVDYHKADPTILAYQGICKSMMAKYVFFPFSKFKYFIEGTKQLDRSIDIQRNLENTYLRIILQLKAPRFLNYRENLTSDIQFFTENFHLTSLPHEIKTNFALTLQKNKEKNSDLDFLMLIIDQESLSVK